MKCRHDLDNLFDFGFIFHSLLGYSLPHKGIDHSISFFQRGK